MTAQLGILESVNIRNYRVFNALSMDKLSRINLVAGRNNAGKTSLLEALFLLSGGGNPRMAFNTNVIRLPEVKASGPPDSLRETYWKPLFAALDTDEIIEISAHHAREGTLSLQISLETPDFIELRFENPAEINGKSQQSEPGLLLACQTAVWQPDSGPSPDSRLWHRDSGGRIFHLHSVQ